MILICPRKLFLSKNFISIFKPLPYGKLLGVGYVLKLLAEQVIEKIKLKKNIVTIRKLPYYGS